MTARALGARGGAVQTAKKANVTRPETNRNADATEPYGKVSEGTVRAAYGSGTG